LLFFKNINFLILASSGGGTSGWFGCGDVNQKLWRYRHDNFVASNEIGNGRNRLSSGASCTLIVERTSSNTLTTTNGGPYTQEYGCWQVCFL
jgi:hypothetical protein